MKLHVIMLLVSATILGTLLFSSVHYRVQTASVTISDAIDAHIRQYQSFSGTVLVAQRSSILFRKAYGCANYEFEVLNELATRFPIASNTKLFTAVAIMLLQEKGMLGVHDPVEKYVPGFLKTVTIHHLLTHTSGVPNYYKCWDSICRCKDLTQMMDTIKTWPLEFEPGSRYCYSNTGYLILAHIIETISGATYETFLQEQIFNPLGMYSTGSICSEQVITRKASGYQIKNSVFYNAPSITHPITLLGNGDLYSTADDVHIFMQALFSGAIINQESLDSLISRHVLMDGSEERAHGYGCFIDIRNGKQIVEYSGSLVGFLSRLVHIVDDNLTVIMLTNREDRDAVTNVWEGLLDAIQDRPLSNKVG